MHALARKQEAEEAEHAKLKRMLHASWGMACKNWCESTDLTVARLLRDFMVQCVQRVQRPKILKRVHPCPSWAPGSAYLQSAAEPQLTSALDIGTWHSGWEAQTHQTSLEGFQDISSS